MEEQKARQEEKKESLSEVEKADVEKNKPMAIIGYIIPILFFIPLLTEAKDSKFAKFHAGQQLNLLLFWVIGQIAAVVLYVILIGFLIQFVVWIAGVVFMIIGIINAANGEMKKLPIIGGFQVLK